MMIPSDHLRACEDHRVVGGGAGGSGPCPCCETGAEARPGEFAERSDDRPVKPLDLQWRVEPETVIELLPLMEEYLGDQDQGPAWVTVAELDKRSLPAGYTAQERWFNVVAYEWGDMVKTIIRDENARETIETLRAAGYGGDG